MDTDLSPDDDVEGFSDLSGTLGIAPAADDELLGNVDPEDDDELLLGRVAAVITWEGLGLFVLSN